MVSSSGVAPELGFSPVVTDGSRRGSGLGDPLNEHLSIFLDVGSWSPDCHGSLSSLEHLLSSVCTMHFANATVVLPQPRPSVGLPTFSSSRAWSAVDRQGCT